MKEVHCKPHPCQECGKSFTSPEKIQSHMKSHHHHPRHVQAVRVGLRHPGQGEEGNRTAKHIDTLTRSVVYYSSKSYNLMPKIDEVQDETEAQLTYESMPEQEAPVWRRPQVTQSPMLSTLPRTWPTSRSSWWRPESSSMPRTRLSRYCDESNKYVMTLKYLTF